MATVPLLPINTLPIHTLLVANRGEIARRIMRTARDMGMRTVAVYSDADRHAPHVREADVAVALGGSTATESYLDVHKVLAAAEATGAGAVHPGYGFLSERADAAEAVGAAGLTWVGPHADAIRRMGDKIAAKRVAAEAGIPLLSSVELAGDAEFEWRQQVGSVGFPLLVKAAAGGGGRGMRLVENLDDLADAISSGRREAEASFGDPTVFAERWLASARHVEIQVVADRHGQVTHLGERECSIQRRHQKIIEEAPSPAVDTALRARMGEAAVALARAIDYDSVGTIEFLLDADTDAFYFLEMNTRLQVEHAVTEAVTGCDLVRLQLEAAMGVALDLDALDPAPDGHAIEARIYAEDPTHDWAPSTGVLHRWHPTPTRHGEGAEPLRVDAGVETGSVVSPFYDPMLAKVIAHGPGRSEALARLGDGLRRFEIHGVTTNRDYLVAVLEDADFTAGRTTTDFVAEHPVLLDRRAGDATRALHAVAAALVGQHNRRLADPHCAEAPSGWRNGRPGRQHVGYLDTSGPLHLAYTVSGKRFDCGLGELTLEGEILDIGPRHAHLEIANPKTGRLATWCAVHTVDDHIWVNSAAGQTLLVEQPRFPEEMLTLDASGPTAPTPGRVVAVEVQAGDTVTAGDTLVVMEAMKVEHRIAATVDGRVAEVLVQAGDNVDAHELLVRLEEP